MNKVISFNEFTEDVSTYVDFVIDSGNEVVVNERDNNAIVIISLEEYTLLRRSVKGLLAKENQLDLAEVIEQINNNQN
ncbi:type II toxin-antitoxin system Phd/YefM family antitoxin [Myroides pelagicus]|uniref:Antitoxin n=1 Tax=Myroides pelagicus TaxID=270914 RepID=A0A7K1GN43_9FLAO|nr:type II toxin-antitoxin system Phd/YefM family antitoxin [Myroides pelagicus]MEC4113189.1 type II toxin-antitoxin system Phd/YefM family antitoxin [Myroides pelagicus]MTH30150.1 hypothetical protein [Myroides pelagicus]